MKLISVIFLGFQVVILLIKLQIIQKYSCHIQLMPKTTDLLNQYNYNAAKPKSKTAYLETYDATHKQTNLPYTIKIIKSPQAQLEQYFKKLKETGSEYTIKIYQYVYEVSQSKIILVQEPCPYGTLDKALAKCKRFDNDDSVYIAKLLLNGHIDCMRNGLTWYGNQGDIQITENGVKLSWNGSVAYSEKSQIQDILKRISERDVSSTILPFPPNKMMNDLIAVSTENASEISLHPLLKKKQKIFKKKGKNWMAIRESKVKGEYFQELSYLAVSTEFGLVRVKVMEEGAVDEDLMKIYQTKASFVKILDYYSEKGQFYTVAQYANDGTVQNYVKRLKTSNIGLKQNQIQFFFFSVIQPLKFIHESTVKSLNLLHIRNIFIENGIPKIGQPIPMNNKFTQILIERADVPDFYHVDFKKNPVEKNPIFDTYSLGVLLYKLMYTEYPIFPEGKVHIPTAPTYKKNLRAAIELFLNVGGNLQQLQKQLQISDDVKLEVKNNEKILEQITKKNTKKSPQQQLLQKHADSQLDFHQQHQKQQGQENQHQHHHHNCLVRFWKWLIHPTKDTRGKYSTIYKSDYDNYRKCTTVLIVLLFYFFTFFMFYVNGVVDLFNYTRVFTPYTVNILGQSYKIITPNFDEFIDRYGNVATGHVQDLNETLHCQIDNKLYYYDFVRSDSPHWNIYLALGIIAMIIIMVLKGIQLCKYSTAKVGFHYYDTTISGANLSRFALSSYVFFQLWFAFVLYGYYYLFNYVFHEQCLPCFGGSQWIKLTQVFMLNRLEFTKKYLIVICVVFGFGLSSFIQISIYNRIKYNLLKNPIFVYSVFYFALFLALRIGVYTQFDPSFKNNSSKIIGNSYLNVVGYIPEILVIVEILLCLGIDQLFYKVLFSRLERFVVEQEHSSDMKVYQ